MPAGATTTQKSAPSVGKHKAPPTDAERRVAEAEARAAKAEAELAALKRNQHNKEAARAGEAAKLHEKLKGSKTVASMNFNQDCVIS